MCYIEIRVYNIFKEGIIDELNGTQLNQTETNQNQSIQEQPQFSDQQNSDQFIEQPEGELTPEPKTYVWLVIIFVAAIGLIIGGLFWYNRSQILKRDSQRKQDLSAIAESLEQYYLDYGSYPVSEAGAENIDKEDSILANQLGEIYINPLPADPLSPRFFYIYYGSKDSYVLTAFLENKKDQEGQKSADGKFIVYNVKSEQSIKELYDEREVKYTPLDEKEMSNQGEGLNSSDRPPSFPTIDPELLK